MGGCAKLANVSSDPLQKHGAPRVLKEQQFKISYRQFYKKFIFPSSQNINFKNANQRYVTTCGHHLIDKRLKCIKLNASRDRSSHTTQCCNNKQINCSHLTYVYKILL